MKRFCALLALMCLSVGTHAQSVYVAKLTQSGQFAPTATVLKNTFSGPLVWTYIEEGRYRVTLQGAFTDEAMIIGLREYHLTESLGRWRLYWDDELGLGDSLILESYNPNGVLSNGQLSLTEIRIEVYAVHVQSQFVESRRIDV